MPTDWEAQYRAGDTPWDKGAPAPPLLEWLENPAHRFDGRVLVPGCGLGHDVRALAATGQAEEVCGLDVSPAALAAARRVPSARNETYVEADLFNLPAACRGHFDWVFEHTCFCAIDPGRRADYVRAVMEALRPGGRLFAIFYLQPWANGEARPPSGGPPFGVEVRELDALFAGAFERVEEWTPARAYAGREGRELVRLLRKIR